MNEPLVFRRKEWLGMLAGLVCAAAVVFAPQFQFPSDLLVGRQHGGRNDITAQFLAMRAFPRAALLHGEWPLWNPWMLLGQPWLGNPQAAAWYPPNWCVAAFDHPAAWSWCLVLHQIWGGWGTYCFCRRLGCRPVAAFWGASLFVGAPYCVAQIGEGHFNQVCLAAWIPWAFWAYEGWRLNQPRSTWLLAVIFTAAIFCGHVQEVFYVMLVLSLSCVMEAVGQIGQGHTTRALQQLGGWLIVTLLTAGLSAVEVVPVTVQLQQAVRGRAFSLAEIGLLSPGWDHLWQLLHPLALGGPENYQGSGRFFWETLCHFGLLGQLFALWGLFGGGKRWDILRWFFVLVFACLFAVGPHSPIYPLCHRLLPGVALFRVPGRMLFLASVVMAALAAWGVETLLQHRQGWWPRRFWGFVGLAALVAWGWCAANGPLPAAAATWQRAVCQTTVWGWIAAGSVCALLMTLPHPPAKRWVPLVGALLSVLQLTEVSWSILQTVPTENLRRHAPLSPWLTDQSVASSARILARHEHLSDDEAVRYRLCKLTGYEPVPLVRAYDLFDALTEGRDIGEQMLGFQPVEPQRWNKPLLDWLGVVWLVCDHNAGPLSGWELVHQGTMAPLVTVRGAQPHEIPFVLYRNVSAYPRAFVVGKVDTLRRHESFSQRPKDWDPKNSVLLDRDVLPPGNRSDYRPATIREYGSDRVVLEAQLSAPGYLVLTDLWYPGWKAFDARGQEYPVLRANHSLRAVPLPAGEHLITLTFSPPLWSIAAGVSLITALLGAASVGRSLHRADPPPEPSLPQSAS